MASSVAFSASSRRPSISDCEDGVVVTFVGFLGTLEFVLGNGLGLHGSFNTEGVRRLSSGDLFLQPQFSEFLPRLLGGLSRNLDGNQIAGFAFSHVEVGRGPFFCQPGRCIVDLSQRFAFLDDFALSHVDRFQHPRLLGRDIDFLNQLEQHLLDMQQLLCRDRSSEHRDENGND